MCLSRSSVRRAGVGACLVAAWGAAVVLHARESSASAMATAASRFLASLSPEQRQTATFPFDAPERFRWNFIPTEMFPRSRAPAAAPLRRTE